MHFTTLNISKRNTKGKGAARRMRRGGTVPAIIYGKGVEALSVAVEPRAIQLALAGPMRLNTVLTLKIGEGEGAQEIHAIVRDHQYHPVRRTLLHVDFMAIDVAKPLRVDVPLYRIPGRCVGEQDGGIVTQVFRSLPIECLPEHIPARIDIDVKDLPVGGHVTAGELVLPEGVKVVLAANQSVVTVTMPKAEKATGPGAEGAAAATAEGGADAAKDAGEKKA